MRRWLVVVLALAGAVRLRQHTGRRRGCGRREVAAPAQRAALRRRAGRRQGRHVDQVRDPAVPVPARDGADREVRRRHPHPSVRSHRPAVRRTPVAGAVGLRSSHRDQPEAELGLGGRGRQPGRRPGRHRRQPGCAAPGQLPHRVVLRPVGTGEEEHQRVAVARRLRALRAVRLRLPPDPEVQVERRARSTPTTCSARTSRNRTVVSGFRRRWLVESGHSRHLAGPPCASSETTDYPMRQIVSQCGLCTARS